MLITLSVAPQDRHLAAETDLDRYMRGKADDLAGMEQYWNDRVTYPTGVFNPTWLRNAAAQDAKVSRAVPLGVQSTLTKAGSVSLHNRNRVDLSSV